MSQENVWLDKLDKCLKKSVKTIATDAEEISEELDVSIYLIFIIHFQKIINLLMKYYFLLKLNFNYSI